MALAPIAHRVLNMLDQNEARRRFFIGLTSASSKLSRTDKFEINILKKTRIVKDNATEPTTTQGVEPCTTNPISLNPRFWASFYNTLNHCVMYFFGCFWLFSSRAFRKWFLYRTALKSIFIIFCTAATHWEIA